MKSYQLPVVVRKDGRTSDCYWVTDDTFAFTTVAEGFDGVMTSHLVVVDLRQGVQKPVVVERDLDAAAIVKGEPKSRESSPAASRVFAKNIVARSAGRELVLQLRLPDDPSLNRQSIEIPIPR